MIGETTTSPTDEVIAHHRRVGEAFHEHRASSVFVIPSPVQEGVGLSSRCLAEVTKIEAREIDPVAPRQFPAQRESAEICRHLTLGSHLIPGSI